MIALLFCFRCHGDIEITEEIEFFTGVVVCASCSDRVRAENTVASARAVLSDGILWGHA